MTDRPDAVIARVDAELAGYLDGRATAFAALRDMAPVLDAARSLVLDGGKRLRPTFVYWGWRTVCDETADDRALITAAASLELLHACALVHDDVMDASATRRGRASAHAAFAARHRREGWTGDSEVFGTAAAIILGDLLLSWADELFASAGALPDAARGVYDAMRQLVMAGQYLDVLSQARGAFSVAEAVRVIEFKTSKYTIEGPLHLGAAIADAPEDVFDVLTGYGLALGEAFQLRDDVLGVFGDPAVTGKPAGDDLREGKHTMLTALAMNAADPEQAAALRAALGDRELDDAGIARLRDVIVSTGALAEVESRIAERATQARAALESPHISVASRAALDALIGAAVDRRA